MSVFNLPKTHDNFFTLQFLLIFLIGFGVNVYSNGQATLMFFEDEYGINPDLSPELQEELYLLSDEYRIMQEYSTDVFNRNSLVNYLVLIFYFGVSPLINFYFGFFVFRRGQWKEWKKTKDLNSK